MADKCIACGACIDVCPVGALAQRGREAVLDRELAPFAAIARHCDPKALEMVGRDATGKEVLAVVLRDRDYYAASGGGMTLSGGEPLFQPEFPEALLDAAKNSGAPRRGGDLRLRRLGPIERVTPVVDLCLFD